VAQLAGALYSARAVCLIQNPKGTAFGTGFLIGPDLLLTNNHVLPSEGHLDGAAALFDFANGLDGVPTRSRAFAFQKGFYHSSPPEALDFALVKLTEKPLPGLSDEDRKQKTGLLDLFQSGKHRGYLLLASDTIRNGHRLNILQHPDGMPLKAVLTRNYVPTDMTATRVHYLADTMGGSSGSPVFTAGWEVVALQHSGEPYPPEDLAAIARKAWKGVFRVNEGIPMSAILKNFKDNGIAKFLPGNE